MLSKPEVELPNISVESIKDWIIFPFLKSTPPSEMSGNRAAAMLISEKICKKNERKMK